MKSLSRIVYHSRLLSNVSCAILRFKNRNFKKIVIERSKVNIFDYRRLALPLGKYYKEIITDNNCFGIGQCIRTYCGWKKSYINALIEHGYFFGSYVSEQEKLTYAKVILTFGDKRVNHIKNQIPNKQVIPIGPYIHYASPYLLESQFTEIKKELGKTLLVFFSHSATGCRVYFDIDFLISQIEEIRPFYNSVVISIFWSDITPEIEDKILKRGYKIFSAGHRYDENFLSRLRSMIELADMTMSNSIGTHIAYCTYLNKPHWIIRQEIIGTSNSPKGEANLEISKWQEKDDDHNKEILQLYTLFSEYKDKLSDEQRKICNKFFGFDYVKTPEEMSNLLESL